MEIIICTTNLLIDLRNSWLKDVNCKKLAFLQFVVLEITNPYSAQLGGKNCLKYLLLTHHSCAIRLVEAVQRILVAKLKILLKNTQNSP